MLSNFWPQDCKTSVQKSWQRDRIDLGLYQEQELVTVALEHFQAVLSSNGFDLDLAKGQWPSLTVPLRPQA